VLKPIRWESVRRNELGNTMSPDSRGFCIDDVGNDGKLKYRQQRAGLFLRDVDYVIRAQFQMTAKAGSEDTVVKHREMFLRRAEKGQCFHRPYLGCREFAAYFALIPLEQPLPEPSEQTTNLGFGTPRDLGYMLYDVEHDNGSDKENKHFCTTKCQARFFRATLSDGHIIPSLDEVHS
jgi:CRISPR-associated protein Cas5d